MRGTQTAIAALMLVSFALLTGCASSPPAESASDGELKATFLRGIAQIRSTRDEAKLRGATVHTLASLRSLGASTPVETEARNLAIRGFASTVRGLDARLAFIRNDSGEVEAATRDAIRADRALKEGANLLRAAGRILGVEVGSLNGY